MSFFGTKRIGDFLIEKKYITPQQRDEALEKQRTEGTGKLFGEILVEMGVIDTEQLLDGLSDQFSIPAVDVTEAEVVDPPTLRSIDERLCRRFKMCGVRRQGDTLFLAMVNPKDVVALDTVKQQTGIKSIQPVLALWSHIEKILDNVYHDDAGGLNMKLEGEGDDIEMAQDKDEGFDVSADHDAAPVIRYVNALFTNAVKDRASDIHIESFEKSMRVRYRIDGKCQVKDTPPIRLKNAIVARIKVISGMDIAERRIPQDGRTKIRIQNREIDVRVNTLPLIHGEKVCMRLLDQSATSLGVADLGMDDSIMKRMLNTIQRPHGIVLLCGPTGSGKTTTLYSFISHVNKEEVNITTVEHPVEYQLMGINQCHVREEVGMTFASALRAILRQDPDIIMVGEIRDLETLEMAMKASLTGHLVFSTIHTNTAVASIQRMVNMGAEPFMVSSTLAAAVSQRLLRRIDVNCKRIYTPPEEQLIMLRERFNDPCDFQFMRGEGCANCAKTGFRGRVAVHEVYFINSIARDMIAQGANEMELQRQADKDGMVRLAEAGFQKIKKHLTTISEVVGLMTEDEDGG